MSTPVVESYAIPLFIPCTLWTTVAPLPTLSPMLLVEDPVVTDVLKDVPFIFIGDEYALVIVRFPASFPCQSVA